MMTPTRLHHPHEPDEPDHSLRAVEYAADTYAALRAFNHATLGGPPLPAPTAYAVLGSLAPAGQALHQGLHQLAAALEASAHVYQLYEDDGTNPAMSLARAHTRLTAAATHARRIAELLDETQAVIAGQGYHHHDPGDPA
ncbi:MAG: hypothetical protein ACRDUV_07410 [Pseudonocardiaceae bacterium]